MTVTQLSFNEIEVLARKAAMGSGLPYGVAEDVGAAAGWLSRRGFDGLSVYVDILKMPGGPSVLLELISAIDLASIEKSVMLPTIDVDPLAVLGLASVLGDQASVDFDLRTSGGWHPVMQTETLAGPVIEIRLVSRAAVHATLKSAARPAVRVATVDAAETLAKRTYVPATAASRNLGAGGAGSDND